MAWAATECFVLNTHRFDVSVSFLNTDFFVVLKQISSSVLNSFHPASCGFTK